MTINEAMQLTNVLCANSFTPEQMIKWLSDFDTMIFNEIILTHADNTVGDTFGGYAHDVPRDTELIVGPPYDEMYITLLENKINYYQKEMTRYNISAANLSNQYAEFSKWYNRTHMPIENGELAFRIERLIADPSSGRENIAETRTIYGKTLDAALLKNGLNRGEWIVVGKAVPVKRLKYF